MIEHRECALIIIEVIPFGAGPVTELQMRNATAAASRATGEVFMTLANEGQTEFAPSVRLRGVVRDTATVVR